MKRNQKTPLMRLVEQQDAQGRPIETILRQTYAEVGTLEKVGERLGIHPSAACRWAREFGLEIREERSMTRRRRAEVAAWVLPGRE